MAKLFLNTNRTGYGTDQIRHTMTVGDLIAFLEDFDEDTPIYLKNDNGYTYGHVLEMDFEESEEEDEEE